MEQFQDPARLNRRRFLTVLGAVAVIPACSGTPSGEPVPVGDVPAGNINDLPVGSLLAIGLDPVCVGRDKRGVYAMTLTCSHQGCNMAVDGYVSSRGLSCSCHGSGFDANGNVVQGPATVPLVQYAVTMDHAGDLTIRGGTMVEPDERLEIQPITKS
jgi:nitrite reductase/ring-hydroxylating ferredoxin subunit